MSKHNDDRRLSKFGPNGKRLPAGIYYRPGSKPYAYRFRDGAGSVTTEYAKTIAEAKRLKAERTTDRDRGELFRASKLPLREFGEDWIERYRGRRGAFRESTRTNYRADLQRAYQFFGSRRLCDFEPATYRGTSPGSWTRGRRVGRSRTARSPTA